MDNKKIQTSELDFDQIKQNLKEFLRGQSQFTDYDFEGSGLSILLDVLAYNTHYNALYTNLAVNEAFLDSASKRASIVSKATELGYVPKSARSSTAIVNILALNNSLNAPQVIEIPVGSTFSTTVDGDRFLFHTPSRYVATRNGNQYIFENVVLKEGTPLSYRFEVTSPTQRFTIPNLGVDTSTVRVTVQDNSQSTTNEAYVLSQSILNLTGTDAVYFLREDDAGRYAIEFGNGVVGKQLVTGQVVNVDYMICSQDAPNGARSFNHTGGGQLGAQNQVFVTTEQVAVGGAAPEDVELIRWNAPRAYAAQNRAITADDYRSIITSMFDNVRSVNVWGGEQATPPQFGKVLISIVPKTGTALLPSEKELILRDIINPRKALSITAEIVDPIPIDVQVRSAVYVNPLAITGTVGEVQAQARLAIQQYNDTTLNSFGGVFKMSQLTALIDDIDEGVTSNTTRIRLRRTVTPVFGASARYDVALGNPVLQTQNPEESILSTSFLTPDIARPCFIDDIPSSSGVGTLRMFFRNPQTGAKVVVRNVGTVQYATGNIVIDALTITGLNSPSFDLLVVPAAQDIASTQNQFVRILPEDIEITIVSDQQPDRYTFTSAKY